MTDAPDLPLWAALLTAALVLFGAGVTLAGAVATVRLKTFFERLHGPTLGTSLGALCVLLASMLCFSILEGRAVLHEIVIFVFITITTPITLMLLGRAALYRERTEGTDSVPPIAVVAKGRRNPSQPRKTTGKKATTKKRTKAKA